FEEALIARGLTSLGQAGAMPVMIEHDGEHVEATEALLRFGFKPQRDLITMRRAVRPQDAQL
nr:hypothetical protein [Anaerolineae bacterium]